MISQETTVKLKSGIHARPAQLIVQTAEEFVSDIFLEKIKEGFKANAKSIFNVMAMAGECGDKIQITTIGDDEDDALEAMLDLFDCSFNQ